MKKIISLLGILAIMIFVFYFLNKPLDKQNDTPQESNVQQDNKYADIERYISTNDIDNDGIDDQTDFLQGVRNYIATEPKYKSNYYSTGYPDDGYGVCTDVVAFGMLDAGYDLMELVNEDIAAHPEDYQIDEADKLIDFRRVKNLKVYFDNNAISLPTNFDDVTQWQSGDIIVFPKHIGVVSDKRNSEGIPYMIHHVGPKQKEYEEDKLDSWGEIVGHYRIS